MSPEQDAAEVLARAWRPLRDPAALPVDPIKVATALGIGVYAAVLAPGECTLLDVAPDREPVLYLNEREGEPRLRFACAHAIGHYVARVGAGDTRFLYRDAREHLAGTETDPDEAYANRFAAALLIPDEVVPRGHGPARNPALVALRFGVPADVLGIRLDVPRAG